MALKISVRKDTEVPKPSASGKANEDLEALRAKMAELPAGMVLEVEADKGRSVRSIKALITRAAKQQGAAWRHWHMGNRVFAQPAARRRVRRRRRASR
jgi:uncharacterized protein YggU (UPF0235/DUF167 family)